MRGADEERLPEAATARGGGTEVCEAEMRLEDWSLEGGCRRSQEAQ